MNQFVLILLVGMAGAIGALTRLGTCVAMNRIFGESFPLGTLTVNVLGCFCLGALVHWNDQLIPQQWKLILGVGFLGALTTFSTFGLETVTRYNGGETWTAFANIASNLVFGLAAVVLGMWVADTFSVTPE